jgi:hypothetical protein
MTETVSDAVTAFAAPDDGDLDARARADLGPKDRYVEAALARRRRLSTPRA